MGIALALGALVALLQPTWQPSRTIAGPEGLLTDAPVGLAAAVSRRASAADRVVVAQRWASWFEWAAPGIPVMVDSRFELIPAATWDDYVAIAAGGSEALARLRAVGATVIVADRARQAALVATVSASGSGWVIEYADDVGVVAVPGG